MKNGLSLLLLSVVSSFAFAQEINTQKPPGNGEAGPGIENLIKGLVGSKSFEKQTTLLGISFGFGDYYKTNYKLPDSSKFGSGSACFPVYFRIERAIHKHISLSASLLYDVFYYNYSMEGFGNNGLFYRPQNDKVRVLSPGLQLNYHFDKFIPSPRLDLFISAGFAANYVKHSNYPTSDSLSKTTKADVTPVIKLGVRYYINHNAAFYGDLGYDKMSVISIGFSYRLYGRILSL
jgi:hypothetical protein